MAEPKKAIVGKVVSVGKNAVPAVNPIEGAHSDCRLREGNPGREPSAND